MQFLCSLATNDEDDDDDDDHHSIITAHPKAFEPLDFAEETGMTDCIPQETVSSGDSTEGQLVEEGGGGNVDCNKGEALLDIDRTDVKQKAVAQLKVEPTDVEIDWDRELYSSQSISCEDVVQTQNFTTTLAMACPSPPRSDTIRTGKYTHTQHYGFMILFTVNLSNLQYFFYRFCAISNTT